MDNQLFTSVVSIATAVVGVAIVATVVSKNANTAGVISASGTAFSGILNSALSPVTGGGIGAFNNNSLAINSNLGF